MLQQKTELSHTGCIVDYQFCEMTRIKFRSMKGYGGRCYQDYEDYDY